ncbi:MAG TPA: lysophospholipid acyltransferase family protein [Bryobacteraceae bacterium]|nr:lysophospholipid acyltransferase family protein [Bryobacteraceae bacterium]
MGFPIIAFFVRRLVSIRVEGLENLEGLTGPAIFAATHESKIDAFVLLTALPSRWRYRMAITMGDWVFWQGWFGGRRVQTARYNAMVFAGNVFTLAPNSAGLRGALRHIQFLAAHGWSILVFPEGMHSPWLLPFQAGPGWMAHHTGLPVVPVYIDGMAGVLPRDARVARRGAIGIRIGKPIRPDGVDFRALAERIEQHVHALRSAAYSS